MGHPFDELAQALAQGMRRRAALRRLGEGLAGALLASVGLGQAGAQAPASECERTCQTLLDPRASQGAFGACASSCQVCVAQSGTLCGLAADGGVTCCSGSTPYCGGGICLSCCDFCSYEAAQADALCRADYLACLRTCDGLDLDSLLRCRSACGVAFPFFDCLQEVFTEFTNCSAACPC